MRGTEEGRGDGQRPPRPQPALDESESQQDTPEEDLLGDSDRNSGSQIGDDSHAPADVHHMVEADQGQNRNDGGHEQRSDSEADRELAQRCPAPAEFNDGSPTDEVHQQPVPNYGDDSVHNIHDHGGARTEGHKVTTCIKRRKTSDP